MKKVYDLTDTTSDEVREELDLHIRYGHNIYINGGPTVNKSQFINELIEKANQPLDENAFADLMDRIKYRTTDRENAIIHQTSTAPIMVERLNVDLFTTDDVIKLVDEHKQNKETLKNAEKAITITESNHRMHLSGDGGLWGLLSRAQDAQNASNGIDEHHGGLSPDVLDVWNINVDIETHETEDAVIHYVKEIQEFYREGRTLIMDQRLDELNLPDEINIYKPQTTKILGQSVGYSTDTYRDTHFKNIPGIADQAPTQTEEKQALLNPSRGYLSKTGQYVGFNLTHASLYANDDIAQLNDKGVETDHFVKQRFTPKQMENLPDLMGDRTVALSNTPITSPNAPTEQAGKYTLLDPTWGYLGEGGAMTGFEIKDAVFFDKSQISSQSPVGRPQNFVEQFFTNDQLKQLPFEPLIEDVSDVSFDMDSLGAGLDDLDMEQSTTQNQ